MSTSLLYHAFGCRDYIYKATRYEGSAVIFSVEPKKSMIVCPDCGSKEVARKGTRKRKVRSAPIGLKEVWIEITIPRLDCKKCKKRFEVFPPLSKAIEDTPKTLNDMLLVFAKSRRLRGRRR